MPQRTHLDVVGHQRYELAEVTAKSLPVNNIILRMVKPEDKWLEESMELIGQWRGIFRSIYIKWALALNGLHVAVERYAGEEWKGDKKFFIRSLRSAPDGRVTPMEIAEWNGAETKQHHQAVIPLIAAWGIIDLGSALEEFLFDLFRVYYWANPELLIRGPEFKDLRKLQRAAPESPEDLAKWEAGFSERLEKWQRNAVYKSKRDLFLAYVQQVGLKTPKSYEITTPATWAESLNGVCILRNCLIHPNKTVPKELADFSSTQFNLGYQFKLGDPLTVTLHHLQCTDCFLDQLLTGINLSLVEVAQPKLPT